MCFHYAMSKNAQRIKNRYIPNLKIDFDLLEDQFNEPAYHTTGFSFAKMPIIINDNGLKARMHNWGLIPKWVKTKKEAMEFRSNTINARSETVFEKPSFRTSIKSKRCLIPADGFYEWMTYKGKKYPHFIYLKDKSIFSMAGIWETWTDKDTGEIFPSFSILTTDANPMMAKIHNQKKRMPVILLPEHEKEWLNNNISKEEILSITKPLDENLMEAHTISKLITSRKENSNVEDVQKYYEYKSILKV